MYFDNHDEQARFYGTAFSHKQKKKMKINHIAERAIYKITNFKNLRWH